jgi:two-component system sensor histidine kinase KdpD
MSVPRWLRGPWAGAAVTIAANGALAGVLAPLERPGGLLNEGLLFLLLTLVISSFWGWKVGLFAAVASNLTLNFFFVPPVHTVTVEGPANAFGLAVFLVVSAVGGSLLSRARNAAAHARRRQAESEVLLRLSRSMIGQTDAREALNALCDEAVRALDAQGASVLTLAGSTWEAIASAGDAGARRAPDAEERAVASASIARRTTVALGDTGLRRTRRPRIIGPRGVPGTGGPRAVTFTPLQVGERTVGVLRIDGALRAGAFGDDPARLLGACAGEAALAAQRVELARAASHAEALREANEMKTALMASISHDLRTPLAGIKAAVTNLLDGAVEWSRDDVRSFLAVIESETDRLDRVITEILDLNRIESGVVTPRIAAVAVDDIIAEAVDRTSAATAGRRVSLAAAPGAHAWADEALVVQALVNLVENAAKYSTPGRDIHITARAADGTVEIAVEDEGPGIAPDDLPHLFEPMYRGRGSARRASGSGLGLAIVKAFVELSGGSVRASSYGSGACFAITLPAAPAPVLAPP